MNKHVSNDLMVIETIKDFTRLSRNASNKCMTNDIFDFSIIKFMLFGIFLMLVV